MLGLRGTSSSVLDGNPPLRLVSLTVYLYMYRYCVIVILTIIVHVLFICYRGVATVNRRAIRMFFATSAVNFLVHKSAPHKRHARCAKISTLTSGRELLRHALNDASDVRPSRRNLSQSPTMMTTRRLSRFSLKNSSIRRHHPRLLL